ncbi:DUF4250 domain-containing protein [Aeromonas hydrophila]|uniref:DUF4250 domain-containing protein n=1 Tax=Aeromonas hydrophila subsp. hydrophila (strain ATCC 7966 / DSM 30187 / BCRC 13018 / CCUG 14551 / JCM 1027 / KCTC 2358 / NCIMB 9240 / NCTC 8049) TaxID=380703 RepID=A0KK46_AERHH|nr:DUF4250 domain-containing protein [Aeromonas hydrophila]ABK39903.1 conserved hypothetical protein [Aeromonas hydrophila subsp. hydrophila ATCC 7966]EIS3740744.1 DUF4250 domain-containing protein [Aeromonas hydrophila]MBS4671328.1 DUF4250 domain-containing protein [Aeromonas hydrophila]MCO4199487.1 DUF4250 domain-containing protein [Aeromonas hydrophila]MCV3291758.1 DUF4250 domain-containing protein [Aeromonas hydrophila]
MNLNNFATMDVNMLLSLVNMQLRDRFDDLDDLCKAQDLDKAALVARLASGNFHYQEDQKQFR